MEYSTVIEGVGSGKPYPVNYQFEFDRPSDDIYQITYVTVGTDDHGHTVKQQEIVVEADFR